MITICFCVNSDKARALSHQYFQEFLSDLEANQDILGDVH